MILWVYLYKFITFLLGAVPLASNVIDSVIQFFSLRREYPPLSLLQLQRMIDLGRIDADEPIDLTTLCNTNLYHIELHKRHFGVNLTDEVSFKIS